MSDRPGLFGGPSESIQGAAKAALDDLPPRMSTAELEALLERLPVGSTVVSRQGVTFTLVGPAVRPGISPGLRAALWMVVGALTVIVGGLVGLWLAGAFG